MRTQPLTVQLITVLLLTGISLWGFGQAAAQPVPALGIVASLDDDSLAHHAGFTLLGETVGKLLSPSLTEAQFEANVARIKQTRCKVHLCNVLFPGSMKLVGPQVNETRILNYVDTVFYRAKRAGIPLIVLGSGGSRRLPEGYDAGQAKGEFAVLCRKLAGVAQKHGVTIALESLNRTETNFLNTLQEAAEVVAKVNHPHFRLNADIYHMSKENEPPQHIVDARKWIVYVEIAEKEQRTLPGVKGDDFKPYFEALKSINYGGPIVIEGRSNNLPQELPLAHQYLTQQLKAVYGRN
ncbi:MAG: sugar phosphate isomerase/epimerase [Cytophagales bacterium]|nr:sugar phosphate isomerase/epimerase [Cytophagales bacterium]